jgi:hypothetical protein
MLNSHGCGSKLTQIASHIHIICKQSVLATCDAVDGHMGAPLHCYAFVEVGVDFRTLGVWSSLIDVVR